MPKRRIATVLILATAGLLSGCETFSERLYVPGRDPLLTFLGAEYGDQSGIWHAPSLPALAPMRTTLIPDRGPPPIPLPANWPPFF